MVGVSFICHLNGLRVSPDDVFVRPLDLEASVVPFGDSSLRSRVPLAKLSAWLLLPCLSAFSRALFRASSNSVERVVRYWKVEISQHFWRNFHQKFLRRNGCAEESAASPVANLLLCRSISPGRSSSTWTVPSRSCRSASSGCCQFHPQNRIIRFEPSNSLAKAVNPYTMSNSLDLSHSWTSLGEDSGVM